MLTGREIHAALHRGELIIDPFDERMVCANSIAFRLGPQLLSYPPGVELDPHHNPETVQDTIPASGVVLAPGRLYLGSTAEAMGGLRYAATLHACRSVSSLGLRIQLSAPLGHCGAVIPWNYAPRCLCGCMRG